MGFFYLDITASHSEPEVRTTTESFRNLIFKTMDKNINVSDSYNIAYNYLKSKYGYRVLGYTNIFSSRLHKASRKKDRDLLESNATEKDYNIKLNDVDPNNWDDKCIELYLGQYYYGYTVRYELYEKLCNMKIIIPQTNI